MYREGRRQHVAQRIRTPAYFVAAAICEYARFFGMKRQAILFAFLKRFAGGGIASGEDGRGAGATALAGFCNGSTVAYGGGGSESVAFGVGAAGAVAVRIMGGTLGVQAFEDTAL